MEIQQLNEKYLPMLHELQTKIAMLADMNIKMEVEAGECSLMADITVRNSKDRSVNEFCTYYFWTWETEDQLNEKIINLNAFFASKCIVSPVQSIENPTCLNRRL